MLGLIVYQQQKRPSTLREITEMTVAEKIMHASRQVDGRIINEIVKKSN